MLVYRARNCQSIGTLGHKKYVFVSTMAITSKQSCSLELTYAINVGLSFTRFVQPYIDHLSGIAYEKS